MPFHSFQDTRNFTEETSIITVLDYGTIGDGVADDRSAIQSAVDAASGNTVLLPTGTYRIGSDITVPGDVTLWLIGKLSVDTGVTVTINGKVEAGLYEIFSGSGSVTLAAKSVREVYPQWWGAVGDDSTDNASAFNAAMTAAQNIGQMCIPAGVYRISAPITNFAAHWLSSVDSGPDIVGAGRQDTILKYTGTFWRETAPGIITLS